MAPVLHGTSACASSAFAAPTTNKIGAMGAKGAMVPAYFSLASTPATNNQTQFECRSNIVECYNSTDSFDKVERCFDIVVFLATMSNKFLVLLIELKQIECVHSICFDRIE